MLENEIDNFINKLINEQTTFVCNIQSTAKDEK